MSATGGTPAPHASPEEVRALAERLLSTVREDVGRADTKAAILLSGALAFLAVLFARDPDHLAAHGFAAVLVALAAVLWSAGMLMLVGVVLPRTRIGADRTLLRDLVAGAPAGALLDRLTEAGADTTSWLLDQASVHGQVLAAKYRWLRTGVLCLGLGAALALSSELW
ncbi:Pycsar system effector family protein [Streptomyces somaliensis]|uniref:Pycsar effector protein domain-containing protein n=2 Tax=Streptomyces somaliensis TaxID=78355 RepID=A0AA44DDU0_STRE0|nr:Pycsar system effector family protein [Streptomyces somaliensis]NKY14495.1 hypothetical protein [Streptomyces somaliensis DSM 40738]